MENAFSMGNQYKKSFGYVNRILPVPDLLYATDVLVTNNGRLASAFSILEKPLYVCRYNKNYFEKYVSLKYPEMYSKNCSVRQHIRWMCAISRRILTQVCHMVLRKIYMIKR